MEKKILYSAGYGNQKPADFLARLKDAGVTVVMDVRRKGCKSWCGAYRHAIGDGFGGMENLMKTAEIKYVDWSTLSNLHETVQEYKAWLDAVLDGKRIELLVKEMNDYQEDEVFCLLCAERDAYKDGAVNCHRVYVADALVKLLGDEWEVQHI